MERYREQNNADKALDAGRKALAANPDSVTALSGIASVLSEKTRDTDLDKEERWAEATKAANHLLELGDNMKIPANPGTPPEQVNAFRDQAKGMAYIALGTIDMNRKNDAAAAENFKKAIATDKNLKDPVVYLRQSVVLDRLKQYPDALASATKVVELAPAGSRAAELGKQEQQRLQKLAASGMANPAGGTTAGAPATAPSTHPSAAPATAPSPQPTTQASDPQK
jgi:tetratricopeptide (TPR) repeat protein